MGDETTTTAVMMARPIQLYANDIQIKKNYSVNKKLFMTRRRGSLNAKSHQDVAGRHAIYKKIK